MPLTSIGNAPSLVITGLVPVIPIREAQRSSDRDGREVPTRSHDPCPFLQWEGKRR
jgi:hypothetical protein